MSDLYTFSWDALVCPRNLEMPHSDFVHLRVHSAYSLLEGAIKIQDLVELCASETMPAVSITDTRNLFGALEFSIACAEKGVQPIVGCQISLGSFASESDVGQTESNEVVLLVQNEVGYRNLLKLMSASYFSSSDGNISRVNVENLATYNAGLILLTGGPNGAVGRKLLEGQTETAEVVLLKLREIFRDRLYIELMRHNLEVEDQIEPQLLSLADQFDVPLVATNEVFFSEQSMFDAHDALLCIAEGSTVGETQRRRLTPEHYFKTAQEMTLLFDDIPEAVSNTLVIAQRCSFMVEPREPMLPTAGNLSGESTEAEMLQRLANKGLKHRLARLGKAKNETAKYQERLDFELEMIIKMGFSGYFLIVSEFVGWAKDTNIPVGPGRGSGAGSVVSWALEITDLDPIKFGLLFERFLNPERVSMPDFDIDFCQDRRDEVIEHVKETYGTQQVAQIITFGKLQARAVLRDVGRVLGMAYGNVDRLCKLVPNNPAAPVSLQQAIDGEPRLKEALENETDVKQLIDISLRLEGLYRHASTHAAGVVIGDRPLDELVPLHRDPRSSMLVTQFNMKDVEKAGLVKFDFLGLKTLTVLDRALKLIRKNGIDIELHDIPLEDSATYRLLEAGDTVGVFQMESAGVREVLRKLKADRFEDLIAVVALYRPGPMSNIPSYIERKHGREQVEHLHETLEPVLRETYGIMIYQEQVMQIAQVLSGFSLGEADVLRRAMGKKIKSEMTGQRQRFIDGAVKNKLSQAKAAGIFDQVDKFSGYGFNKSHAAAYALVAYQTAYLKANYPTEFMTALMTLEQGNTDKLGAFHRELSRLKIRLHPPDINKSTSEFEVENVGTQKTGGAIRYSLAAIRNVGANAITAIVKERKKNGSFRDLFDFARRIDPSSTNKRQFLNLVKAGAFDQFNSNRAQVGAACDILLRHTTIMADERGEGQESLFGTKASALQNPPLPVVEDWPEFKRLREEADALGFYLSAHPLDAYGKSLQHLGVVPYSAIVTKNDHTTPERTKLAVVVQRRRERNSARGRYAFLEVSDQTGIFELTIFSDLFSRRRELLEVGSILLVDVTVQREEDSIRLVAQSISKLDEHKQENIKGFRIYLKPEVRLEALSAVIDREKRGTGRVAIIQPLGDDVEVEVELAGRYAATPALRAALKSIPGVIEVSDI